jgi:hypothetical protein
MFGISSVPDHRLYCRVDVYQFYFYATAHHTLQQLVILKKYDHRYLPSMNQAAPVRELRQAIKDCTDRGLLTAAKWLVHILLSTFSYFTVPCRAGELLIAIPLEDRRLASTFAHSTPARPSHPLPETSLSFSEGDNEGNLTDAEADEEEADLLEVAKTYYAMKELDRAAHLLRGCKGPKARFLAVYCRFLVSLGAVVGGISLN